MPDKKKIHPTEKVSLHPRNRHRGRYDFKLLIGSCPELAPFVKLNEYGDESVDFFNPAAIKTLNKALLKYYYGLNFWEIPKNYLCPPIPGRADYIHYIADLLGSEGVIPKDAKIKCLDVGVGANCVYPIIGNKEYRWSFIGSDIDPISIESAKKIVASNPSLKGKIELRLQPNSKEIFQGIIKKGELIDLVICNPPFHGSLAEAQAGTVRKLSNLKQEKNVKPSLNFGGQNNELWCDGGEERFVRNMVFESKHFATSCLWFSSLVAKQTHLDRIYNALKKVEALEVKTIRMGQGNKVSRIVAWTFLNIEDKKKWRESYP